MLKENDTFSEFLTEMKVDHWIDAADHSKSFDGQSLPNYAGNMQAKSWKPGTSGVLFKTDDSDLKMILPRKLKATELLFKYETETTKIAGMKPFVIINTEKAKAYFYNADTEAFETRAVKLNYLNLTLDYKNE